MSFFFEDIYKGINQKIDIVYHIVFLSTILFGLFSKNQTIHFLSVMYLMLSYILVNILNYRTYQIQSKIIDNYRVISVRLSVANHLLTNEETVDKIIEHPEIEVAEIIKEYL